MLITNFCKSKTYKNTHFSFILFFIYRIAFKYINRSVEELKKNANSDDKEITLLQSMLMTKGLDISGAMVTVADMLTAGIETVINIYINKCLLVPKYYIDSEIK